MYIKAQFKSKYVDGSVFKSCMEIIYSLFVTIVLLLLSVYVLSFYEVYQPPIEELIQLFTPMWRSYVLPKPQEHFLYISLLILLPFLIVVSIVFVRIMMSIKTGLHLTISRSVILIIPVLLSFPFLYHSDYIKTLVPFSNSTYLMILFFTILYVSPLFFSPILKLLQRILPNKFLNIEFVKIGHFMRTVEGAFSKNVLIAIAIMLTLSTLVFQVMAFRVVSIHMAVSDYGAWGGHIQAVLYAITQVVGGKTLLSDLPAQYGLYPELLRPYFLLFGLSVFKFTLVLGALQLLGSLFLFLFLFNQIKNIFLLFICSIGLFFMTSLTWILLAGSWDPIYQIMPIRFLFPAISVLIFSFVAKKPSILAVTSFSLISGTALIWNLDTGIPIYGAFLCYLASLIIFQTKSMSRTNALKLIVIALIIPMLVFLLFIGYLQLKAHSPLNLIDALKYQNIFYVTGFGMIPIARGFSPWQVICAIYILGLTVPIYGWLRGYREIRWDTVFYLSIMGLGLFSYHEGRSHTWTLIAISWPAFIISFIVSDCILRLVHIKKLPYVFSILCYPTTFFGVLLTVTFFNGIPTLYKHALSHWGAMLHAPVTPITQNIDFIKSLVKGDKEAIIISPLQSIYYGETGLVSPVKGPGHIEILLQADYDSMVYQLINYPQKHIFVQLDGNLEIPTEYLFLLKKYKIEVRNESMAYLTSVLGL